MSVVYVDSRRAWGTVVGGFVANFLLGGLAKSYGLIMEEYQAVFNCGSAILLMAGGLIYTLMYCLSIVIHVISQRFGCRIVVLTGAFGSCFSLLVASWAPNVAVWVVAIGVGVGASLSCIYFTVFSVVGQCFRRYLGMANGLSVAGVSVGQMAFPSLLTYLNRVYGTRNATVVMSAICLHLVITSVLMPRHIVDPSEEAKHHKDQAAENNKLSENDANAKKCSKRKSKKHVRRRLICMRRPKGDQEMDDLTTVTTGEQSRDTLAVEPANTENLRDCVDLSLKVTAEGDTKPANKVRAGSSNSCAHKSSTSLYKSLLVTYVIAKIFADIGDVSVSFIAPGHGTKLGLSQERVSQAIAFSGAVDLVARLGVGWLTDRPGCVGRRGIVLAVTWLVEGFNALAFSQLFRVVDQSQHASEPSTRLLVAYFLCFGVHGITSGTAMTQMVVVLCDWVGSSRLPHSLAITMVVLGLVISPGQYGLGKLADLTGDYILSMQCCCLILLLGGSVLLCEFPVRWYYRRHTTKSLKLKSTAVVPGDGGDSNKSPLLPKDTFLFAGNGDGATAVVWEVMSSDDDEEGEVDPSGPLRPLPAGHVQPGVTPVPAHLALSVASLVTGGSHQHSCDDGDV